MNNRAQAQKRKKRLEENKKHAKWAFAITIFWVLYQQLK